MHKKLNKHKNNYPDYWSNHIVIYIRSQFICISSLTTRVKSF